MDDIVNRLADKVSEIRIGYDGNLNEISPALNHKAISIVPVEWEGYSITKNKLALTAANDWILSLDSDEVPDESLVSAICALNFDTLSTKTQFSIRRYSFFEGKMMKHGSWGNDNVRRLYNKTRTQWDNALVHESLEQDAETIHQKLQGSLMHFTADDYQTFLNKSQRYARLSADKYFQQDKKATPLKRYISPLFSFVKEFVFQAGFLDGARGWKIAKGNAIYTYWKYKFLKEKEKKA
ncbi:glycosyltransferase family 2 protein [Taibaiella lutea]|uniref:Glycosyltransferase family 2 protein n=1 Tax=Taibaiella lutea TaxID=2608001 RepID=A0A5M6CDP7_9BACT|nr:glycosyltransferase family 2 protein [Taibaiella lutea]KAA5532580.1 glycosyltransferase family 2 protein [Taibaiella lutea]